MICGVWFHEPAVEWHLLCDWFLQFMMESFGISWIYDWRFFEHGRHSYILEFFCLQFLVSGPELERVYLPIVHSFLILKEVLWISPAVKFLLDIQLCCVWFLFLRILVVVLNKMKNHERAVNLALAGILYSLYLLPIQFALFYFARLFVSICMVWPINNYDHRVVSGKCFVWSTIAWVVFFTISQFSYVLFWL